MGMFAPGDSMAPSGWQNNGSGGAPQGHWNEQGQFVGTTGGISATRPVSIDQGGNVTGNTGGITADQDRTGLFPARMAEIRDSLSSPASPAPSQMPRNRGTINGGPETSERVDERTQAAQTAAGDALTMGLYQPGALTGHAPLPTAAPGITGAESNALGIETLGNNLRAQRDYRLNVAPNLPRAGDSPEIQSQKLAALGAMAVQQATPPTPALPNYPQTVNPDGTTTTTITDAAQRIAAAGQPSAPAPTVAGLAQKGRDAITAGEQPQQITLRDAQGNPHNYIRTKNGFELIKEEKPEKPDQYPKEIDIGGGLKWLQIGPNHWLDENRRPVNFGANNLVDMTNVGMPEATPAAAPAPVASAPAVPAVAANPGKKPAFTEAEIQAEIHRRATEKKSTP